jgi:hypothetical protein
LVQALASRTPKPRAKPKKAVEPGPQGGLPVIITWPAPSPLVLPAQPSGPSLEEVLPELLAGAAGTLRVREHQAIRYLLQPGQLLEHHCAASMPPGVARAKLDGFVEQWSAELVRDDGQAFVYRVGLPVTWWQRWLGRMPVLEVEVKMLPQRRTQQLTEVGVAMRPLGCRRDVGAKLLEEVGPLLLESLRSYLQAYPEQRGQHRLLCPQPLSVSAIQPGLHLAQAIACQGKDISSAGIGFFLPQAPSSPQVYVNLGSNPFAASLAVLAKVVRVRPRGDGWFEVGALFGG